MNVAHVEGGIRSVDWSMPEEINRMVTDAITNYFFTTSEFANENLRRLGVEEERIFFVGHTMIDTLLANLDRLRPPPFWDDLGLQPGEYVVVTLHRPANVDGLNKLQAMLAAIGDGSAFSKGPDFAADTGFLASRYQDGRRSGQRKWLSRDGRDDSIGGDLGKRLDPCFLCDGDLKHIEPFCCFYSNSISKLRFDFFSCIRQ